jgi:CelD/BcsL family acetyltransferase involved in cellulose biosynthesis
MSTDTAVPFVFTTSSNVSTAVRAEVVTEFGDLTSFDGEWTQLWNESPSATIFQSLPWQRAWWKAFGSGVELCTPVIWKGNEVVGVLPLIRERAAVRFLGTPGTDYCDILCREELAPMVLRAAFQSLLKMPCWLTCRLDNLRDDSQLLRHLGSLPASIRNRVRVLPETHRSSLVLSGCCNEVIASMRRKPALKRHRNKMNRSGKVIFRHLEERADAHLQLATLFQQHIGRRGMLGAQSQFLSPGWQTFYSALVNEFDPKKELRFSVLELDGDPIACHFGFECRDSLTLYKPAFDTNYARLSPGDVLLDELLSYAGKRHLKEVDFTIGEESYKQHFTNHTSGIYTMVLDRREFISKVRGLLYRRRKWLQALLAVRVIKTIILYCRRSLKALAQTL